MSLRIGAALAKKWIKCRSISPALHILLTGGDPMIGQSLMRAVKDAGMSGD